MVKSVPVPEAEKPLRDKDAILADLALVKERRKKARDTLKNSTYVDPGQFNRIVKQIGEDSALIDGFLAELFEIMCWEKPELLDRKTG